MKKLIKLLLCTLIFSVVCSQLILMICDAAGVNAVRQRSVPALIYLACVGVSGLFLIERNHIPRMPSGQLREVLETEGYSKEYYAVMMKWHKACEKRGYKNTAALMLAESLIDGGHIRKGLDTLEELNVKKLDRRHKQVYYNTLLYAAVCTGDCETARDIYKKASPWLYTASSGSFAASVKHTLGCYEYLQGNTKRAEYLFMQALDSKPSPDVICEVKMALTLCYLDTGRLELAKEQADRAGEYASTLPLKEKLARTRELAEETFRRKLAETA